MRGHRELDALHEHRRLRLVRGELEMHERKRSEWTLRSVRARLDVPHADAGVPRGVVGNELSDVRLRE